jgi:hypothetical protein
MANTPHSTAPPPQSAVAPTEPDISKVPEGFKLAPIGSRDYVAGQPVDEKELEKTQAEAKARKEAGHAQTK